MKLFSAIALLLTATSLPANQSVRQTTDRLGPDSIQAQNLLRALFPTLNGKDYTVTLEAISSFDRPEAGYEFLTVAVHEGPRNDIVGHEMGSLGCVVPFQLAPPPGMPPSPPPPPPCNGPKAGVSPRVPKQVLNAGFVYATDGRLLSFTADGPAVGNPAAASEFGRLVSEHPKMTDEEIVSALKRSGARFGPGDRDALIRHLPVAKLEQFLGRLQILDVSLFPAEDFAIFPPMWRVKARTTAPSGAEAFYFLNFEPFNGDLISLSDASIQLGGRPSR